MYNPTDQLPVGWRRLKSGNKASEPGFPLGTAKQSRFAYFFPSYKEETYLFPFRFAFPGQEKKKKSGFPFQFFFSPFYFSILFLHREKEMV